jgi:hypothetical protein
MSAERQESPSSPRVRGIRRFGAAIAAALALMAVATCKSKDEPGGAGVGGTAGRDVREACARRVGWKNRLLKQCTQCMSLASAPACGCDRDKKEFSGMCAAEQKAKIDAADCSEAYACTFKCLTDCACVAKCYEGKDKCYQLASAVDGCIAEVCEPFCK